MKINLLITSIGRRNYMVQFFKEYMDKEDTLHVSNSHHTSAFNEADFSVITPLIKENTYIDFLIDYCLKNKINALLSLFDLDVYTLSKHKSKFDAINVNLLISDHSIIELCSDKWKTYQFLTSNGFRTPLTFQNYNDVVKALRNKIIQFPIIVKPRFGSGSIGYFEANDLEDLLFYTKKANQLVSNTYINDFNQDVNQLVLYQNKIIGNEYNLDIINDLDSSYQTTVVKQKLEMRAGETDKAIVLKDEHLKSVGYKLSSHLKHRLNCDCDLIVDTNNEAYIIDLNPRFGGGYPFSQLAGINLPRAILSWLKKETIDYEWEIEQDNLVIQKDIIMKII